MNYPFAEGSLYDRIVEEFSRGYRPGTGAAAELCPADPGALDALAEDLVPAPIKIRFR
jgi:hypothetical protein